jgi:cytochrome c biogenesis protein ResB
LGHADIERYRVMVDEGATVGMHHNSAFDDPRPLPMTVTLHDFAMEEYPATEPGARPVPRSFSSDITLATPDGRSVRGVTRVNHPLGFGGWRAYQYGYDRTAGPASTYSVIELVRDPWIGAVYIGFAMIALGALTMILNGRRRHDRLE